MGTELLSLSGLVLMFVLGLRHGLDPDHIACIDGLTWRALSHDHNQGYAPWIGTLFAIGHGLLVTSIAVGVSRLTHAVSLPEAVVLRDGRRAAKGAPAVRTAGRIEAVVGPARG